MKIRSVFLSLLLIALASFVLGFGTGSVSAQDETETVAPVVEVTEVAQFPDPVIENPGDFSNAGTTWFLLLGLGIVSGIGIGAGGVVIITNFLGTKAARDAGEKMYEALAPDAQERFLTLVDKYETISSGVMKTNEAILAYFKSITDGQPNEVG